jgi:hypothetical protein
MTQLGISSSLVVIAAMSCLAVAGFVAIGWLMCRAGDGAALY